VIKKNILVVIFIIIGMIVVLNYNDHGLKKAITSCVIAQKRTAITFDIEKASKFCEEKIRKQIED
jgi:hypothetical protein